MFTGKIFASSGPKAATNSIDERKSILKSIISGFKAFLQPARLTTACAAVLILALLFFKFGPASPVSAAELLHRSSETEAVQLANKDRVLHRTLNFEEFGPNS